LHQWESEKKALEPRQLEFLAAFNKQSQPTIDPPLTSEQLDALRERLNAAWGALFYPAPDDCAKVVEHGYLSSEERIRTLEALNDVAIGQQEIEELLRKQSEFQTHIEGLSRKISRLEGIKRDGTLAALTALLEDNRQKTSELSESMRADERLLVGIEAKIIRQRAEYERDRAKLDESSPARVIIERSDRVRHVIESLIPALFPLKVGELAANMTLVYKQLAHKEQVERIEIKNDGTTEILSKSGKILKFDRSAGENQIFATALIAGLAKVSGVNAPLVVDTPLGRLDSTHRDNILQFWTSDRNRQVILLSQDKEIDANLRAKIGESISCTYLLTHEDVGDGIGRTTAHADEYFSGAAA
jgi:DNA sulfur modification protein DndD